MSFSVKYFRAVKSLIDIEHVSVTYGDVKALDDVSLKINDNELAFIVGENGAGKSTMIKLLIREVMADPDPTGKSSIIVNGYDLIKLKKKEVPELRRTIGFIFQDYKLISNLNVYDNVAFVLRSIDAPMNYIRKTVPQALALVGLQDKVKSMPNNLSGGEQQRVAIARAIVNNPQIIIADEPTGNIDPRSSISIMKMFRQIQELGTTVVIVTHEHDLVSRMGGRLIELDGGKIKFDGVI